MPPVRITPVEGCLPNATGHQPATPSTRNQPREQSRLMELQTPCRFGTLHLGTSEQPRVNKGGVGGQVHAVPDPEFAQVNPVLEQPIGSGRGHHQVPSDLDQSLACRFGLEAIPNELSIRVRNQFAGSGVPVIAFRGLPALPNPCLSSGPSAVGEPDDVFFTFPDSVGEVDVADEPTVRGAGVQAFRGAVDVPAGFLNPRPNLQARTAPCEAGQVCDNDPLIAAGLAALNGPDQTRPVLDGFAAADGEFWWHELNNGPLGLGVSFNFGDLIPVSMEGITAPSTHMRDSNQGRPGLHAVDYSVMRTHSSTEPDSAVGGLGDESL